MDKATPTKPLEHKGDRALEVILLAAGQGTRMRSDRPKVLHHLGGRPLLAHVLQTVSELDPAGIRVVVGHQGQRVRDGIAPYAADLPLHWVEQAEQLGTGHAVMQALPAVEPGATVLVVYGDVPLVTSATLLRAVDAAGRGELALVTVEMPDPGALGRIVREPGGEIKAIVEFKDASPAEREIREINSGIMAAPASTLADLLTSVKPANAQGEYYLTDVVALAVADEVPVHGLPAASASEVRGVNDRLELAQLERCYQHDQARCLMLAGVTLADPERLDVRGRVSAGRDCFIDVNVVLEGRVLLGEGVTIGPGAVIRDSSLGDGVSVEAHTVVDGAKVAAGCSLGPFARIRPGTVLGTGVKIGNFVETKKAVLGAGTKASHLAYLGDATIGDGCNVGAGTVTCNYDGVDKHPTIIGDGVFVGTNSTLVAPLVIEKDAYVGAGSTITTKVGKGDLAVGRGRQRNIQGWVRPDKRNRSVRDPDHE